MTVPYFLLLLLSYTMRSFKDIPSNQRPNQCGKLNLIPLPVTKSDIFPSNCFRVFLHNEPTSYAQTSSSSSSPPSCSLLTSSLIFLASVTSFKLSSSKKIKSQIKKMDIVTTTNACLKICYLRTGVLNKTSHSSQPQLPCR